MRSVLTTLQRSRQRRGPRLFLQQLALAYSLTLPLEVSTAEPTASEPTAAHAADKSGTNPANFSKTLQMRAEGYSLLDNDNYGSKTELIYSMPLGRTSKLEFEVPFLVGTDLFGPNLFAFGDVSVSWKTRPYMSHKMAVIAGVEVFTPSGSRDKLSSNRWSLGPTATWAFFFPAQRLIFAPTYEHQFSISDSDAIVHFDTGGGDSNTGGAPTVPTSGSPDDIHKGTFDLYLVYRFANGKSWITVDPAIVIDYENDNDVSASIAPAFGRFIGTGRSISVQPVIPLTDDAMDWGIKLTFKQVF
jgi:hypothetical protein